MDPDYKPYPGSFVSFDPRRIGPGALAGLVAGILFGIVMQLTGLMQAVADATGTGNILAGWAVHLVLSALFGLVFGALANLAAPGWGLAWGIAWGVSLWTISSLVLYPTLIDTATGFRSYWLASLLGHLLYGATLGLLYAYLRARVDPRADATSRPAGY